MSQIKLWVQVDSDDLGSVMVSEKDDVEDIIEIIRTTFDEYSTIKSTKLNLYRKRKRENGGDIDENFSPDMTVKVMLQESNYAGSSCANPIFIKHRFEFKWKPVEIINTSSQNHQLHITQRQDAFENLKTIHENTFSRRKYGHGGPWIIPLMDNLYGMGKSAFARSYIDMYQNYNSNSMFAQEIKQARTIHVHISKFQFENYEQSMLELIRKNFEEHLVYGTELFKECDDSISFLKQAVHYGPIFLILDGIGELLKSAKNLSEAKDMFWILALNIFKTWCCIKKLYFVLVGYCPYVTCIPAEEPPDVLSTPFYIERLPLVPLNSESIADIIRFTKNNEKTLYEHYNLDDEKLKNISKQLFFLTNGKPRELKIILDKCKTYEMLLNYNQNWKLIQNLVCVYQEEVDYLLRCCIEKTPVNLTRKTSKTKRSAVSLYQKILMHEIAAGAGFTWNGDITSAVLQISESCKNYLLYMNKTLKKFLKQASKSLIFIDKNKSWEWMCTRKIVELFLEESTARDVCPEFLNTPVFGSIINIKFSEDMIPFITQNATSDSQHLSNCLECLPVTLIPFDSKPNAILCSNCYHENSTKKLVVGLSIKNFSVGKNEVDHEYQLFVDFLQGKDVLRILIIFCLSFKDFKEVDNKFFYCYEKQNSKLDEIIVLNLTNKEMRERFFGLPDAGYKEVIEMILAKK